MPYQVDDALLHAMSGTELSRVRTELRLLPEPNNQRLLMSRGADIVMQSSAAQQLGRSRRLMQAVGLQAIEMCPRGTWVYFQSD